MTAEATAKAPLLVYKAGFFRTIAFAAAFLLLSPYFVSLAPMLYARLSQGIWLGTPGLIVLAILFTLLMALIVAELGRSIRSRIALGETRVRLTLPQARVPIPFLGYRTHDIAYSDIAAVEMRREVYGWAFAPVLMKGARLRLKSGETVALGYVNEANLDPSLPFSEIAEKIAARAGVEIVDHGDVRRSAVRKLLGIPTRTEVKAIDPAARARLNTQHDMFLVILVGVLVVLVGAGIVSDLDSDIGHARAVPQAAAPAVKPAAAPAVKPAAAPPAASKPAAPGPGQPQR